MALSTYYVDTDVVGGTGDGSSLVNAYSSLNACISARAANIVGSGNNILILCYATAGTADTTACTTSGFTCSYNSGETVEFRCGQTLTGTWNTGIYRLSAANTNVFSIYGSGIIVNGLQIELTGMNANYQQCMNVTNISANNPSVMKNCLLKSANSATFRERPLYISIGTSRVFHMYNNVIYNVGSVAHTANNCMYFTGTDATGKLIAYKNVFSGGYNNITYIAGIMQCKNNIFCNATNGLATGTPTWTGSDYNSTDQATMSGGAHDRVGQTFSFKDEITGDYTLTALDTGAKGFGVDLAADTPAVSADRLGIALISPFDIGAYQLPFIPPSGADNLNGLLGSLNMRRCNMIYYGDFNTTQTVKMMLNTFDSTGASCTVTDLANTDIHIHKNGGTTQRASSSGVTVAIDFDGITGNHLISIDLSDNADAGFYSAGAEFTVRAEGITVDGNTINAWIGGFSIENRSALMPITSGRRLEVSAAGTATADRSATFSALNKTIGNKVS